jgi:hypothetical protein
MSDIIFETAREVLRFKNHTTIIELARLTGLKQLWILKVLNHNHGMVYRHLKNGHITRVERDNVVGSELAKLAYTRGLTFRETTGNYGAAKILETASTKVEHLKVTQCWGGMGDSQTVSVLNDAPATREALRALDITLAAEFDYKTLSEYRSWVEDPEVITYTA